MQCHASLGNPVLLHCNINGVFLLDFPFRLLFLLECFAVDESAGHGQCCGL